MPNQNAYFNDKDLNRAQNNLRVHRENKYGRNFFFVWLPSNLCRMEKMRCFFYYL